MSFQHPVSYQQDGAPPHSTAAVTNYLNQQFPNRWMGLRSDIPWPARSPDFNPLDYFLWPHIKNLSHREPIPDLAALQMRILEIVQGIPAEHIANATNSFYDRLGL